jgi:hypothetical protein
MPRNQYQVRVTGDQREKIDPHQIAQILIDLILQESDIELAAPDREESPPASWGGVRRIERSGVEACRGDSLMGWARRPCCRLAHLGSGCITGTCRTCGLRRRGGCS